MPKTYNNFKTKKVYEAPKQMLNTIDEKNKIKEKIVLLTVSVPERLLKKIDRLRHYCKNGYDVLFLVPNESMKKFVDEKIKIYNWKRATFKTQIINFL